ERRSLPYRRKRHITPVWFLFLPVGFSAIAWDQLVLSPSNTAVQPRIVFVVRHQPAERFPVLYRAGDLVFSRRRIGHVPPLSLRPIMYPVEASRGAYTGGGVDRAAYRVD